MYNYEEEKPWLFTEAGFKAFLKIRDAIGKLPGNIFTERQLVAGPANDCPDSFKSLAIIDRLVELGELKRDKLSASGTVVLIRSC